MLVCVCVCVRVCVRSGVLLMCLLLRACTCVIRHELEFSSLLEDYNPINY